MSPSRRTLVIAVVVAAVAAVAIGWWPGRQLGAGAGARAARPGHDRATGAGEAAGEGATSGRRTARVPLGADPVGGLRLEGQVIDHQEAPVGGAIVVLDSYPQRTAVSEPDGGFVFEGLLPRGYALAAGHLGARSEPVSVRLHDATEPVILRIHPGITVAVRVVDRDSGAAIAGATVRSEGWIEQRATSGADGVAELPGQDAGFNYVVAEAEGYAPEVAAVILPDDPGGRAERTIELGRGGAVVGTVVDPAGHPVVGAEIHAQRSDGLAEVRGASRDDGTWRLPAVGAGTYTVSALVEGFPPVSSEPIALDGVAARDGVVLQLIAGGRIAGVVVDQAGAPVPHAQLLAVAGDLERRTSADATGRFTLPGLPRGVHQVVARSDDRSSPLTAVDITAADVGDLTVTVVDATISGVVVTPDGEPVAEASLRALPQGEYVAGVYAGNSDVTDSSGRFRLGPLPVGSFELSADWPDAPRDNVYLEGVTPVLAKTGDHEVRLVLPPAGSIAGTVLLDGEPMTAFGVAVNDFEAGLFSFSTPQAVRSTSGRFERRAVPPGTWVVAIGGDGVETTVIHDVVVKAGAVTDLGRVELGRGRVLSGRVVDAAGAPVAGATVAAARFFAIRDGGLGLDDDPLKSGMAGARSTITGDDGRFTLRGLWSRGARPLRAIADHRRAGRSREVDLPAAGVELTLTLERPGAIAGVVTAPPPGETLYVQASPVGGGAEVSAIADRAGRFRIDRLPAGSYQVSAQKIPDPATPPVTVEVRAGEAATVELAFPAVAQTRPP